MLTTTTKNVILKVNTIKNNQRTTKRRFWQQCQHYSNAIDLNKFLYFICSERMENKRTGWQITCPLSFIFLNVWESILMFEVRCWALFSFFSVLIWSCCRISVEIQGLLPFQALIICTESVNSWFFNFFFYFLLRNYFKVFEK